MSYLPLAILMSVPRSRRRQLIPLALPAVANIPVAQAGALAVVTADAELRRRDTAAATAVASTIEVAVDKGALFNAADFAGIPIARDFVAGRHDLLQGEPATPEEATALLASAIRDLVELAREGLATVRAELAEDHAEDDDLDEGTEDDGGDSMDDR